MPMMLIWLAGPFAFLVWLGILVFLALKKQWALLVILFLAGLAFGCAMFFWPGLWMMPWWPWRMPGFWHMMTPY